GPGLVVAHLVAPGRRAAHGQDAQPPLELGADLGAAQSGQIHALVAAAGAGVELVAQRGREPVLRRLVAQAAPALGREQQPDSETGVEQQPPGAPTGSLSRAEGAINRWP